MVWTTIKRLVSKLPRPAWRRPSRDTVRKMTLAGILAGGLVGAFYWGRQGGLSEARAQSPSNLLDKVRLLQTAQNPATARDVVATIYDGAIPITRQELGEYLIERFGAERVEFLVNRRIIEWACQAQKIVISDAEVQAQLEEDAKSFKCSVRDFVNSVLKPRGKTLFEWKEDVIKPKLCLQRYVKDKIVVTEDDIRKAFEAKHGEKMECRVIVLSEAQGKEKYEIWTQVSRNPEAFDKYAKEQFLKPLAAEGGKIPHIHHHYGDQNLEREVFKLKPGEVSPLIGMPDKTTVIVQCVNRIPPDALRTIDSERMALHQEIAEARLGVQIKAVFEELRKQAKPQIYLRPDTAPSTPSSLRQPQPPQLQPLPAQAASSSAPPVGPPPH